MKKANAKTGRRREKSSQDGAAAHQRMAGWSHAVLGHVPGTGTGRDRDLGFGDRLALTGKLLPRPPSRDRDRQL